MARKRKNGQGTVRLRKDGRWEGRQIVVYDENGKAKTKSVLAKTKAECLEKLKQLQNSCGTAKPLKIKPDMRFGDWIGYWYETHCRPTIRPTTQKSYEEWIYVHVIPGLGHIHLNKLTQADCQKFLNEMKANGRKIHRDTKGPGMSERSVRSCYHVIRMSLERAIKDGLIKKNPILGCKLSPPEQKEMKVLSREEIQRFLLQAKAEGMYELFLLELTTGLRRGELLALRWDDLNIRTGELHINKLAGFTPDRLLYVCNNVSAEEMKNAADNGLIVSVDSLSQLDQYGKVNPGGKVMIRINPGIGAGHHKKVITAGKETKFGIDPTSLDEVRALLKKHSLTLAGVNQHIGSLFMEPDNYLNAIEFLLHFVQSDLADLLPGIEIIDFGGGLGIPYRKYEEEPRLDMAELGRRLHALLSAWVEETGYKGKFFIEPGRYVVAECGVLLGTVHATKFNGENRYVGTDLGFNVLVRPAMYDSFHDIEIFRGGGEPDTDLVEQSIVGNICESGDILAKKRMLPLIKEGDIVAALDAGAYGFVMSSSYNQRPRAAEVLITSDGTPKLIRRRETLDDLTRCFVEE